MKGHSGSEQTRFGSKRQNARAVASATVAALVSLAPWASGAVVSAAARRERHISFELPVHIF